MCQEREVDIPNEPEVLRESEREHGEERTYDVVVIGLGAAGASAAIEAAEAGRSVLVLDRFYGGGATVLSGGIVYAGAGTAQQREAGVSDTPENMLAYLRKEVGGAVSEETLRRFVEGSPAMIAWLERHGAVFEGSLCPYKTSYPTNQHYLYYSGNEHVYRDVAAPAPRGHRIRAKNFSGHALFEVLREAVFHAGAEVRTLARAERLIMEGGRVVGVEYTAPPPRARVGRWHRVLTGVAAKMQNWAPPLGTRLNDLAEATRGPQVRYRVRARRGVILAGGGYAHSRALLREHAPQYLSGVTPLGTIGDDGSVIGLGTAAGGRLGHMANASGWRMVVPPSAFARGVLVGPSGARIGNEQLYGSTLAAPIVREHGGRAYLILGDDAWKEARREGPAQAPFFLLPQLAYWLSPLGHVRARDVRTLASRLGVDAEGLEATLTAYDRAIAQRAPDPLGKSDEARSPLLSGGPLRAIDFSAGVTMFAPFPFMTLGGLVVDESTGAVLDEAGDAIPGIYAAGRSAVGLCSVSYVSGLSLADAIFSGRRAGLAAARAAKESHARAPSDRAALERATRAPG